MTLADIVAVMYGPDRVRITKGSNELFAGYLGNLVHMAEYEALMAEEVTRLKEKVDITHKRYKELGLMQPDYYGIYRRRVWGKGLFPCPETGPGGPCV